MAIDQQEGALLGIAGVGAGTVALSIVLDRPDTTLLGVGTGLLLGAAVMFLHGRLR